MNISYTLYPEYLTTFLVIFIALALTVWYSLRKSITGRVPLAWIAFCTALWAAFYLLGLLFPASPYQQLLENAQYTVLLALPPLVVLYTLDYIHSSPSPFLKACLWLEPVIMLILLWADPYLHWLDASILPPELSANLPPLLLAHGWAFWVNGAYLLLALLACIILLARELLRAPYWLRIRTGFMLIAAVTALAGIILSIPGNLLSTNTYIALMGTTLSQLIVLAGASQRQTLALLPIARETLLEQMQDPVIVVNLSGEISGYNRAAINLPGFSSKVTGRKLTSLTPEWQSLNLAALKTEEHSVQLKFASASGLRYYDVVFSPVKDNHDVVVGSLIVLREATRQINTQNELSILRRLSEEFNQAADLHSAAKAAMQTICQLTTCRGTRLQLVDSDGMLSQAFELLPDTCGGEIRELDRQSFLTMTAGDSTSVSPAATPGESNAPTAPSPSVSRLSIPLLVSGKTLGSLTLDYPSDQEPLPNSRLHLIQTICNSLSVTIERILLFEQERSQREQAETMQNISQMIISSLDYEEVLDRLLEQLELLVPYDAANIMWIDGPVAHITRSRGYDRYAPGIQQQMTTLEFPVETTENVHRILTERTALIIPDTSASPGWMDTHLNLQFHSWLGAPVIIEGEVVAIFSLDREQVNTFTRNDAARLSSFAMLAGLSIQNARLYESGHRRIRELEELQATLAELSGELDQDQLLQKIVNRAITLLDVTVAELALYDPSSGSLQVVVSQNPVRDTTGQTIQMGEGLMGAVAQTRQAQTRQFLPYRADFISSPDSPDAYAALAVPMLSAGELVGVLGVGALPASREFSSEEIRLLSLFAQQATVAIHNARLYRTARRQATEFETLMRASSVVISNLNLSETLDRILEQLSAVVPFDSASVLLLRSGKLEIVGGHGFGETNGVLGTKIGLDRSNPGALVYLENRPLVVNDMLMDYPTFGDLSGKSIRSWLAVPLNFQGNIIGVLSLDSARPGQFSQDDVRLIQAFADQVSIALENVILYEKAVKAANRFEIQYRLTQEINANLSQDQVCNAIHRAATSLMPTECFMISLLDEAKREIVDIYMVDQGAPMPLEHRPASEGLFARVIADGMPRLYGSFDETEIARTGAILMGNDDLITQSILCVPLRLGSKIKGVISVQSYLRDQYSQEDLEQLELLAGQGAIALENSRLFGEVQQLAITDPLTQLFNRRRFFELAEQEFDRSQRYGRPLSVIILDIDHFKRVNDTYGHYVGDQVLQQLAEICTRNIRAIDILARYGGEEFVIVTPETAAADAAVTCERLRTEVAREAFPTTRGPIPITISLGVVDLSHPCRSLEELLDRSDQALYHSKENGRNRTSIWEESFTHSQHSDPGEPESSL